MGTSITFKRPDGKDASGYLANAARGNAPGVVVIQEWWGLSDQIKGLCDRFALAGFDAVLSPTVPITAPPIAEVAPGAERDAAFFRVNGLLLRNPSVVNMLDGCALSLPCQADDELPVGLMIWHAGLHDDDVLSLGLQAEQVLAAAR